MNLASVDSIAIVVVRRSWINAFTRSISYVVFTRGTMSCTHTPVWLVGASIAILGRMWPLRMTTSSADLIPSWGFWQDVYTITLDRSGSIRTGLTLRGMPLGW